MDRVDPPSPRSLGERRAPDSPRRNLLALHRLRAKIRRLRFLDGSVLAALFAVACLVASFLLDWSLDLPTVIRGVFLVVGAFALFVFAFRRVVRPLSVSVTDESLAMLVEESHPELRQSLVTAIQLTRPDHRGAKYVSPALLQSVIAEVEERAASISYDRIFRLGRFFRNGLILALALVAGVAAAAASPELAGIWLRRNLLLSAESWPKDTRLEAPSLPETVAIGDDLLVEVRVLEGAPKMARIITETVDGEDRIAVMNLKESASWDVHVETLDDEDVGPAEAILGSRGGLVDEAVRSLEERGGRLARGVTAAAAETLVEELATAGIEASATVRDVFFHEFRNISRKIRFRVEAGDDAIGPYEVDVRLRPRIDMNSIRVAYRLPEYTGLVQEMTQEHGHLKVPVGTRVSFRMRTNIPVARAFLVVSETLSGREELGADGAPAEGVAADGAGAGAGAAGSPGVWPAPGAVDLPLREGRVFEGTFVVRASGFYFFQFEGVDGFRSEKPERFRIQAVPDRKPEIHIVEPGRVTEEVSPEARVLVRVTIEDDYGLRRASLEGGYFAPGSERRVPQSIPLELPPPAPEDGTDPAEGGAYPRSVEIEYELDVAAIDTGGEGAPAVDGRFEFYVLAEDTGETERTAEDGRPLGNIGESQVHLLVIVDKDTLQRVLTDRLMVVRDQLRQLEERQSAVRRAVADVREGALLEESVDAERAAELGRPRQDQGRITQGLRRQAVEIDRILDTMESNAVGDDRWKSWVSGVRRELGHLADEQSPAIESSIDELRRDASSSPAETSRLGSIVSAQRELERDLLGLVLRLEEFGDKSAVIELLREAKRRQEYLRDETRRQIQGEPATPGTEGGTSQ